MAQFGVKVNEPLPAAPNYEFIVTDINEVPNDKGKFAYDPATDAPEKATKWEWLFTGRAGTPSEGKTLKKRTVAYLTTDPRNGWHQYSSAIDPAFDPKKGYESVEDFKSRCIGRPVMLALSVTTGDNGNDYNNIDKPYPSTMPALSTEELIALTTGGSIVAGADIPF